MIRLDRRHATAALLLAASGRAFAWPDKPITLIVPFGPGGIADITARTVAQQMATTLKQTIVIDNRPSAGSVVGSTAVAQAAPDGHTLLLMSNGNAVSATLFKKLPFDVVKDFTPIATLGTFDLAVFVAARSRFKTLGEVIAHARQQPGRLTIGTITVGSTQQLSAELFKIRAGIDAVTVPYKGTPAVLTALRAGEIDIAFEILGPMLPQVNASVIRALAVTSDTRFSALPSVPTVQQAGVANYEVSSWNALAAPAGTPHAVVMQLNRAANEALQSPAVQARLRALGVRPQGSTPERLQALLASEIARWNEVIDKARIERQ